MSIKVKNVNYTYSEGTAYEMHALKNINLEIPDGQFVGLIGHTGSGKSTLTQHLNGLTKATSGKIYFNGKDITEESPAERARDGIFLSFQSPIEAPGITLGNFIRTALEQRTGNRIKLWGIP